MQYNHAIVDTVNLAYKIFKSPLYNFTTNKGIIKYDNKKFYGEFVQKFFDAIQFLDKKFVKEDGKMTFLFDNYHSRAELSEMLKPLKATVSKRDVYVGYKSNRVDEKKEFYNSLDFIRYLLLIGTDKYHTARIPRLEADDLVKPCIDSLRKIDPNTKVLLISDDSDWCRYLDQNTDYLPGPFEEPRTRENFVDQFGFEPLEETVILFKLLNGDKSDNIAMVFPEMKPVMREYIIHNYKSVVDFMFDAPNDPELKEFSSLIMDRKSAIAVTYQVLKAHSVGENHFAHIWTTGRNSSTFNHIWNKMFAEVVPTENLFSFKTLKLPRKEP